MLIHSFNNYPFSANPGPAPGVLVSTITGLGPGEPLPWQVLTLYVLDCGEVEREPLEGPGELGQPLEGTLGDLWTAALHQLAWDNVDILTTSEHQLVPPFGPAESETLVEVSLAHRLFWKAQSMVFLRLTQRWQALGAPSCLLWPWKL